MEVEKMVWVVGRLETAEVLEHRIELIRPALDLVDD